MKDAKFSKMEIGLTDHAFERYVDRVGPIEREALLKWCKMAFKKRYRNNLKQQCVEFGRVWWGYKFEGNKRILLTTCYGKFNHSMEVALKWQMTHHDHVDFKKLEMII